MTDPTTPGNEPMTHEEATELSGLYVLDALDADERAAVEAHLASCAQDHPEFDEVGGLMPALASVVEPVDAPPQLKAQVMSAYARETATAPLPAKMPGRFSTADSPRTAVEPVTAPSRRAWRMPTWAGWATAAAAVVILAVVGVYAFQAQSRATDAEAQAAVLSDAIGAFSAPGSSVAVLQSEGSGSGFAAVTAEGEAYVVMTGMEAAPAGQAYQAWYIADGTPVSAGLMTLYDDGYAVLVGADVPANIQAVALTVEPAGGSDQPTTTPFVVGEIRTA